MKIRSAVNADLFSLLKYGSMFWEQTLYGKSGMDYNPEAVGELCGILINDRDAGFLLVLEDEDKVVGFVLIAFAKFVFEPTKKIAAEVAYYVDEEYRNGKNARMLLEAAEQYCRQQDITYLTMVSMESCDPRRAEALYEDMGYNKVETSYIKEL